MGTEEQSRRTGAAQPRRATRSPSPTTARARPTRSPIDRRHDPRDGPPPDQGRRRRLRPDDLRPGVHEHRVVPLGDHLPRRRGRRARVPRLPDRAARRAVDLPRGRLPARQRRAADQQQLDEWTHEITIHTFVHENVKSFMQGFRYDAHPMGMLLALGRRAVDVLSRRQRDQGPREPPHPDHPADRQDADARRLRLPPQHGPAVRLSRQRPGLPRQLPEHDVQDDRAEVRARPAARARARHPLHPARRPRAELLDQRGARGRLLAGRPLLRGRRRRRRALRPAARRRQRGGAADAASASRPRRTSPTSSRA